MPRLPIDLLWMVQLDCLDLNPWPVRAEDLDRPDELRVDLDPSPDASFAWVREVALLCGEVLAEHGLVGWPKTSGSRGIHIFARIAPEWGFTEVRRAALALAREVERRRPDRATSAWWKEQRHGVFIDYNQNARDRTMASAYSVRQTGLVSAPLRWDEVPDVELEDFPMVGFRHPVRRRRRPDGRHGLTRSGGSTGCWIWRAATPRAAWATRPGRRTFPSRTASPPGCNPRGAARRQQRRKRRRGPKAESPRAKNTREAAGHPPEEHSASSGAPPPRESVGRRGGWTAAYPIQRRCITRITRSSPNQRRARSKVLAYAAIG